MNAVIIDAIRTPIARAHAEKGMYRDVRADDLSADLMKALLQRTGIPATEIEDIHWGCVKQEREQGYDVAKMAALIAGLPVEVGGCTVNLVDAAHAEDFALSLKAKYREQYSIDAQTYVCEAVDGALARVAH